MKFESTTIHFYNAVQQVSRARSKSMLNPLLQCISLEVEDFTLIVRATNLEIICEKNISVKGIHEKPLCCGIAKPASPLPTPSSGKTGAS